MKVMKDMTVKLRSKERMDAENRWWQTQKWSAWSEKMKKEDEKRKMEEMYRMWKKSLGTMRS